MKRILSITGIMAIAMLLTSAISIREIPQDPPRGAKAKKHIKVVKVDEEGKKMKLDTVIESKNVFVFTGDSVMGGKGMKWVSDEDFDFDFDMDFDFDVKEMENGKVVIMKSGKGDKSIVREFKIDGDSAKEIRVEVLGAGGCEDLDIMKWHGKHDNDFIFKAPHAPKIVRIEKRGGNVIDLSDPGIISFDKKELKDGKEKIVIIREKPSEKEIEVHEEIIMHGKHDAPVFFHGDKPHKVKRIEVIAGDEGDVKIMEDGKVWTIDEMEEGTKVIEKDGKKIVIKKQQKGKEMKFDVEVEEKIEESKEHK